MNQKVLFDLSGTELMIKYDSHLVAIKAGGEKHVVREAFLLRNVMMARMDGAMPPFMPGDIIIPKFGSVNSKRPLGIVLSPEQEYRAKSLEYLGNSKWLVEINEKVHVHGRAMFPAESFEKVYTPENQLSNIGLTGDSISRLNQIRAT